MVMPMKKKDTFKMLYIKCAEELNCDARHIKLLYVFKTLKFNKYLINSLTVLMANCWIRRIRPKTRIWRAMN